MYKGVATSPGIVIGKVYLFKKQEIKINQNKIDKTQIDTELIKYKESL